MLYWAVVFFILAIVAGIFGFGGVAAGLAGAAKILFFVFVALLIVSAVMHVLRGKSPNM